MLEQIVRSRPDDWKAVLHFLDAELRKMVSRGDQLARRAYDYLGDWITGHFFNLEEIRSFEKVITEIRTKRPMRTTRKGKARSTRRG